MGVGERPTRDPYRRAVGALLTEEPTPLDRPPCQRACALRRAVVEGSVHRRARQHPGIVGIVESPPVAGCRPPGSEREEPGRGDVALETQAEVAIAVREALQLPLENLDRPTGRARNAEHEGEQMGDLGPALRRSSELQCL